jgi:putative transposase
MGKYKHKKGCAYNLNYHLVWCPKRRKPVLVGNVAEDLKTTLNELADLQGLKIEAMEVMPDYIHLFVASRPELSPHVMVKKFKGAASKKLRSKYPHLLQMGSLWSSSYYVGSFGHISESVVRLYIENQKGV